MPRARNAPLPAQEQKPPKKPSSIVVAVRLGLDDPVLMEHFDNLIPGRKAKTREGKRLWYKGLAADDTERALRAHIAELEQAVYNLARQGAPSPTPMAAPLVQVAPVAPALATAVQVPDLEDLGTAQPGPEEDPAENLDTLLGSFIGS